MAYIGHSPALEDYTNSVLVNSDGTIVSYDPSDESFKEGTSSEYDNYDCLVVDDETPSTDFSTSLTAVTLMDGSQALVNTNDLNLDQDNAVQLDDGSTLLIQDYPQHLFDGQQIQLADGRVAILHATTEQTEGYQAVELEDGSTAFIALSDLMGEPLDPSNFVTCEDMQIEETDSRSHYKSIKLEQSDHFDNDMSQVYALSDVNLTDEEEEEEEEETIQYICDKDSEIGFGGSSDENAPFEGSEDKKSISFQDYSNLEMENSSTICLTVSDEITDPLSTLEEDDSAEKTPDEVTEEGDELKQHTEEEKADLCMRDRTKSIMCPEDGCGKYYTTFHHLKVHQRAHTGDRPFACTVEGCNKAFSTGYGRKAHVRTHTGEKPYKCPDGSCDKSFKTSGDLQKHIRTHTGERPFLCPKPECGRSFTTSNIRKVHYRTHTGERPYLCQELGCGRAFASATNYKNHTRIHSGEKPYVCSIEGCIKRFTEYSSLYKHHMVHTQQKPYHCSTCERDYRQASTLTMHKRTAHGIVEADDGTEIILGETVFAFADAGGGGKRLKALGSNFLGYNKKGGGKILAVQAEGGNPDVAGQQFLVLANSAQIAALEHLGVSTTHAELEDDSDEMEEDDLDSEAECILSGSL